MKDSQAPIGSSYRPQSTISRTRYFLALILLGFLLCSTFFELSPKHLVTDLLDSLKPLSKDPDQRALQLLQKQPIIDGHIDLPILARYVYANQIDDFDLNQRIKGHVDIPRLRKGHVGGFFWSVFVPCPEDEGYGKDDRNFTTPSHRVRDTLEQIDVARLLIDRYSDTFELVSSAKEWRSAIKRGKIGGMLGVEGGHQLGSSLSTLRTYHALGVRYLTLTHTCDNALGDTCTPSVASRWNGLSPFGRTAVRELNRLGMMVDISHVSPQTASDALSESKAPVIFSHSNARGVHSVPRNIPDSILRRIGKINHAKREVNSTKDGEGGKGWGADNGEVEKGVPGGDALICLNFAPEFISEFPEGKGVIANLTLLADHADYIGRLAGREHVGIGSDFDGILSVPEGLEDVSKYPSLISELIKRGWNDKEIVGLAGGNMLRILSKVEATAHRLHYLKPSTEIFEGRTDLKKHDGF
ncbi:dipeptidase [Sporobolomyces salmoneus]|uniref:dipeptidase n=1 Tax=Sporobolomyces salmoneus TaxID=183962 RepID=UPI00316EE335